VWLEARLGATLASLLHLFRPGEVPPLAGEGAGGIADEKVLVIRAKPRRYPEAKATQPYTGSGSPGRYPTATATQPYTGTPEATEPYTAEGESRAHVYGALSKEARLYALGLLESS
jgi:hypothetical protein